MHLAGKVALVTRAGGVVGQAVALDLARRGAKIAALDLPSIALGETAELIRQAGGTAAAFQCDISDRTAVGAAVSAATTTLGHVDILINVTESTGSIAFEATPPELVEREIAMNLVGHLWVTQAVLGAMRQAKKGRIINVGTTAAVLGAPAAAVHGAAEGGLIGFTASLAKEMARFGITVNCVCAGLVESQATRQAAATDAASAKAVLEAIPMKRMARPQEIAATVAFLASDRAAYITGLVMSVDGGSSRGP